MSKVVLLDLPSTVSYPFFMDGKVRFIVKTAPQITPNKQHRMPNWMSPHLHVVLEQLMTYYPDPIITTLFGIPYHLIHGLICGYNMKEVVGFLKRYYFGSVRRGLFRVVTKQREDKE